MVFPSDDLGQCARAGNGDWLFTAPFPDPDFAERCYQNALFTLPNMVPGITLLANPVERYCIDFDLARDRSVDWFVP